MEKLKKKKEDLAATFNYINEGIKIRSRANWYESGERDTRYFNQLLHANKKKCIIKTLVTADGDIIDKETDVLKMIKSFYSKLYSKEVLEDIVVSDIDFFKNLPTLSNESKKTCEGKICEGECFAVLKEMKQNKSPGNDGLTVEFYTTFWTEIKDILIGAFNEAFEKEELSASQKQAVVIF